MKKIFLFALILQTFINSLYALDSSITEDPVLIKLLDAQRENNPAYAANEAYFETGELQFNVSKSMLYPRIDTGLNGAGSNSFLSRTPAEPSDIELKNNYSLSISPELSISQLLPTSGILSGSISDTVTASGLEESNSPLYPAQELEYNNRLDFSVGLSQPLYFGNAYEASRTQINESREITRITYKDNRNALIISAVNDYYDLVKTAYQENLIEKRLETNRKYEMRMLREHELGMWTKGQLNTAKAVRLQSEADLLKASQAYNSARQRIKDSYGIDLENEVKNTAITEFTFTEDSVDLLNSEILSGNPDCLINMKRILLADSDVVIEEKKAAPSFKAGGNYSLSSGISEESFSDNLSFSLGLSVAVLDGGSASNIIEMKKNEAERLRNNYSDQQKRAVSQLQSLIDNISVSRKLSEIYQLQEEAAAFDFDRGNKELELGSISSKELLDLQITLENTRLSLILNKIEYNLTILQIYRLLGADLRLLTGTEGGTDK